MQAVCAVLQQLVQKMFQFGRIVCGVHDLITGIATGFVRTFHVFPAAQPVFKFIETRVLHFHADKMASAGFFKREAVNHASILHLAHAFGNRLPAQMYGASQILPTDTRITAQFAQDGLAGFVVEFLHFLCFSGVKRELYAVAAPHLSVILPLPIHFQLSIFNENGFIGD